MNQREKAALPKPDVPGMEREIKKESIESRQYYKILSRRCRWILPNNGTRSALISRTCFSESASSLRRSMRDNPRTPSTHPRRYARTCIARNEKNPMMTRYASTREIAITGGNDLYATQIPFRV